MSRPWELDASAKMEASLAVQAGQPRQLSMTERLEIKRANLEGELQRTNEALEALKANPEIERVMNLVQRASGGY